MTLQLADRSVKVPQEIMEDVLVQIDKFYFPMDFIVLDTQPHQGPQPPMPVILGKPFLATSNAIINCKNGILKFSFGNITLKTNIFRVSKQPDMENETEKADLIQTLSEEYIKCEFAQENFELEEFVE